MEQSQLRELEEKCIQDCPPPCVSLCPLHVDVRQLAAAVQAGDFPEGYRVFRKAVPFPGVIALTCSQPCQQQCNRNTIGGSILVRDLELACVAHTPTPGDKFTLLPKKKFKVAVVGGGLSGLTAAYDLSRKGYQVTLFEAEERLGGQLWDFPETQLPRQVIESEVQLITRTGVDLHLGERVADLTALLETYDALYLGCGNYAPPLLTGLKVEADGLEVDPVTFQTAVPKVFAAGSLLHPYASVFSISDGRRAAISIDRFLQGVSLTASRANEGAYQTQLYTNIGRIPPSAPVLPAQPAIGYSVEEAAQEAQRCLLCECMECVKACEYLRAYGKYPRKYVREVYNNFSIVLSNRSANKFINSCTLCGLCAEVCPTGLDMGQVNREAREYMVKIAKMPASAHDFALRDMDFSNSEKAAFAGTPPGASTCSILFFPGCQLAASNPEYIPLIYDDLRKVLPDLGILMRCCGAPADWSGEREVFDQAAAEIRTTWESMGKPAFITACSSCAAMLKKGLPGAEIRSLWQVYNQYDLYPQRNDLGSLNFVIHDPCTSRHQDAWQTEIRQALDRLQVAHGELEMSGGLTECCGYGGVAWLANPDLTRDIVHRRTAQDPADYLTYCVMCRDFFAKDGKRTLHLLDLIYGNDLQHLAERKGPYYFQRHENRVRARQSMERLLRGKEYTIVESYEKYKLELSPEIQALMEDRLILTEDLQKVIEHAETTNEKFINQESGHNLAYFKPNIITYWVEYSRNGDAFMIHDAYSHRMEFQEGTK